MRVKKLRSQDKAGLVSGLCEGSALPKANSGTASSALSPARKTELLSLQ